MKNHATFITNFLLICVFFTVAYGDTLKQSRADRHAPIGVMGDHGHKIGEMMLSYRFMRMDMQGLKSDTTTLETAEVLKDFMMVPTQRGQLYWRFPLNINTDGYRHGSAVDVSVWGRDT